MNKKLSKILSVVLAVLMLVSVIPLTASAAVFSGECGADGDNLTWKIDESTATLYINGTGDMKNYSSTYGTGAPPWNQYYDRFIYVSIGDEVSSIGDYAFVRCSHVDEIEIGKGINDIGYNAFDLENQTITVNPENRYLYIDENDNMLSNDNTILYYILRANYFDIPDGVVEIRASAFANCLFDENDLLYIPASVQNIDLDKCFIYKDYETNQPAFCVDENNQYFSSDEYGALYNKDKTIIYRGAAAAKKSYPYYEIPETVIEIADYAFYCYCGESADFTNIGLPQNLKRIGKEAFWVNAPLKLFIPVSVEQIDSHFCSLDDGAGGCTTVYYEGTQAQWDRIYSPGDMYYEPYAIRYEHTNHIFKDKELDVCTTASMCITCSFISEVNIEHDWNFYYQQDSTCADGYIEYRCNSCRKYKTETIPAISEHTWEFYSEKEATCSDGYIKYQCVNCENYKTEPIPATSEHDWEVYVKQEATCVDGYIKYRCNNCASFKTETIPAANEHDWEVSNRKSATCVDGYVKYICNECGDNKTETIPATGEHESGTRIGRLMIADFQLIIIAIIVMLTKQKCLSTTGSLNGLKSRAAEMVLRSITVIIAVSIKQKQSLQ